MKIPWWLIFLIGASPALAGVLEDTVAMVNGEPILLSDYRREFSAKLRQVQQDEPDDWQDPLVQAHLKQQTLQEMIDRVLLCQVAAKEGVKAQDRDIDQAIDGIKNGFAVDDEGHSLTPEQAQEAFEQELKTEGLNYSQFRDRIGKDVTGRKLIEQEVGASTHLPSEKDVHVYFNRVVDYIQSGSTIAPANLDAESSAQFMKIAQQVRHATAERLRVSNILVAISPDASDKEIDRAFKKAQSIRQEVLQRGTSNFADIARAQSEDAETSESGGDLGVVARGEAAPGFEKAVFALALGEVSQPILTGAGWRLVLVRERSIADPPEFSKFKDKLGRTMEEMDYRKRAEKYVEDLRKKAEIKRRTDNL